MSKVKIQFTLDVDLDAMVEEHGVSQKEARDMVRWDAEEMAKAHVDLLGFAISPTREDYPLSIFTVVQNAPWPVGTKLRYTGNSQSGFEDDAGNVVWSHIKGVIYTVVDTFPSSGYDRDSETGERYPVHGWSVLHSELDPDGKHGKAIDVDSEQYYQLLENNP